MLTLEVLCYVPFYLQILKSQREKDRLERFLARMDDPNYGRTLVDPVTKREVLLTEDDVDMIKRIQVEGFVFMTSTDSLCCFPLASSLCLVLSFCSMISRGSGHVAKRYLCSLF